MDFNQLYHMKLYKNIEFHIWCTIKRQILVPLNSKKRNNLSKNDRLLKPYLNNLKGLSQIFNFWTIFTIWLATVQQQPFALLWFLRLSVGGSRVVMRRRRLLASLAWHDTATLLSLNCDLYSLGAHCATYRNERVKPEYRYIPMQFHNSCCHQILFSK